MAIFEKTYESPNLSSYQALYQSFIVSGIYDIKIELNGNLHIATDIGNETTCDLAVAAAAPGTLLSNKTDRIKAVVDKTAELLAEGVETWTAGIYAELSELEADKYYTAYQYFTENPAKLTANTPYMVRTLDGRAVSTSTITDLKDISERAADRLTYLYTAVLNADSSKGEMTLITSMAIAADQSSLDAVVDTRV